MRPLSLLRIALPRALAAFRCDRRGVSAVEFALIAPILILTYFGMAELSQAMMAQRRTSHAASAVGDLVAQARQVQPTGTSSASVTSLADVFSAASTILAPFPTSTLQLRVASVTGAATTGTPTVDWCDAQNTTCKCADPNAKNCFDLSKGATPTLPTGLITAAGDNVIVAESTYTYKSPVAFFLKDGLTFTEKFYLRPRLVAQVPCPNCTS
jgi:Flp pilus assembly protein TadG